MGLFDFFKKKEAAVDLDAVDPAIQEIATRFAAGNTSFDGMSEEAVNKVHKFFRFC
jgi:hypothetical protein